MQNVRVHSLKMLDLSQGRRYHLARTVAARHRLSRLIYCCAANLRAATNRFVWYYAQTHQMRLQLPMNCNIGRLTSAIKTAPAQTVRGWLAKNTAACLFPNIRLCLFISDTRRRKNTGCRAAAIFWTWLILLQYDQSYSHELSRYNLCSYCGVISFSRIH